MLGPSFSTFSICLVTKSKTRQGCKGTDLSIQPFTELRGLQLATQGLLVLRYKEVRRPTSNGAVHSTIAKSRSSGFRNLPLSRRFVNAAPNCRSGPRTGLLSELKNSNAVERSAGDQPCGRVQLEISVEQRRKCSGASIDVLQQTSVIEWGN